MELETKCIQCNGSGSYNAGCLRGCLSVSRLSHQYWDTYSQHGGVLRCTCNEITTCTKCHGTGLNEPVAPIAVIPDRYNVCNNCEWGYLHCKCSTCDGKGSTQYIASGPCYGCNSTSSVPPIIKKNITIDTTIIKNPLNDKQSSVYNTYANKPDPTLSIIKSSIIDPFQNPTNENLYYRLHLATQSFTTNKIFLNVRSTSPTSKVPTWDKTINGHFFIDSDGRYNVDYEGYASRMFTVFDKCYVLVNPLKENTLKEVLTCYKFEPVPVTFVELPSFLPFFPNPECTVLKFMECYHYNVPIKTIEYLCKPHKLTQQYPTSIKCHNCKGSGRSQYKCSKCSGSGYYKL